MRREGIGWGAGILAALAIGATAVLGLLRLPHAGSPDEAAAPPVPAAASGVAAADDLAVAFGSLIDLPRPQAVVEEGLRIADQLRRRYGVDTGDPAADRQAAAHRAQSEFLDRLTFTAAEVEEAARSLGHSLDPSRCADFCDNVRRLAIADLKMRALRAFADGHEWPVRLPDRAAGSQGPAGR